MPVGGRLSEQGNIRLAHLRFESSVQDSKARRHGSARLRQTFNPRHTTGLANTMKTTDELTHELLLTDCVNMGHADLKQWLDAAFVLGLDKAVQILKIRLDACWDHSTDCDSCVARRNSIVDIQTLRNSVEALSDDICLHESQRTRDGQIVCNICGQTLAP